jgi:hypothetical protein
MWKKTKIVRFLRFLHQFLRKLELFKKKSRKLRTIFTVLLYAAYWPSYLCLTLPLQYFCLFALSILCSLYVSNGREEEKTKWIQNIHTHQSIKHYTHLNHFHLVLLQRRIKWFGNRSKWVRNEKDISNFFLKLVFLFGLWTEKSDALWGANSKFLDFSCFHSRISPERQKI